MSTLMDRYEQFRAAEGLLEEAVSDLIGGEDWWEEGGAGLPFKDWYFDTYDKSVELVETTDGWEPTQEHLKGLEALGIGRAFVSYSSGASRMWWKRHEDGLWASGGCSARGSDRDKRGLVKALYERLARAEAPVGRT